MWFPYTLPAQWKAECNRERVHDSQADSSEREFLVGFFLRNPISQENQVELHLEEPQWLEFNHQGSSISVGFYPQDEERLAEILIRIQATAPVEAVTQGYDFVCKLLDHWAVWYGRGFGIDGFRVADLRHEARWRAVTHRPSSEQFTLPDIEQGNDELTGLFSLYRTVRTANSPIYRFLCAYKLIVLISNNTGSDSLAELATTDKISKETLVISGLIKYQPELEGCALGELPQIFKTRRESLIAGVQDLDSTDETLDIQQLDELDCISNLLDITCHNVLSRLVEKNTATEELGEAAE